MTTTIRLRSVELTGVRRAIRRSAFIAISVTAMVAAIAYLLPAHRLVYVPSSGGWLDLTGQPGESMFHSLYADGGPLPLVVLPIVAGLAVVLSRTRRLGFGMLGGLLGAGAALLAFVPLVLVHLFSRYESTYGDALFALAELALFFISAALFVGEPILYLLERHRRVRATRPAPLPIAQLVR